MARKDTSEAAVPPGDPTAAPAVNGRFRVEAAPERRIGLTPQKRLG